MNTSKVLSLAALAFAGLVGTGTAQAGHPDVRWSVQIGVPVPVYSPPAWRGRDRDRDGVPDRYDSYDNRRGWCDPRTAPPAWRYRTDRDRDGVPDWRDPRDDRGWRDHRGHGYHGR